MCRHLNQTLSLFAAGVSVDRRRWAGPYCRRGKSHDPAPPSCPRLARPAGSRRLSRAPNRPRSTARSKAWCGTRTGAVLPGVTVSVANLDTGAQRTLTSGRRRRLPRPAAAPRHLHACSAEMQGFKTIERTGVTPQRGPDRGRQLHAGGGRRGGGRLRHAARRPIAEPGKIDLGRTISEAEIRNLPLVSRNPYNFAFLQANVTGYENEEFGVPRINANGTQMHTNYQIDGNTNTEKDRAGLRLLPASEIMVQRGQGHHQRLRPRVRPDHGHGLQRGHALRAPTSSRGSASYRFRRKGFSERPFFLAATAPKPDTHVNNYTATLGGPDREGQVASSTCGYEYVDRDLSADRVITRHRRPTRRGSGLVRDGHPRRGRHPGHPGRELLPGQDGLPARPRAQARPRATSSSRTSSPYNIGERPGTSNTVEQGHGLPRPHGLRLRPAHLLLRVRPPQRAARAVRAAPPVPHGQRGRGHRARHHRQRRGQLRRARSRPSPTPASTSARRSGRCSTTSRVLRGRHNFKVGVDASSSTTPAEHPVPALHLPHRGRLPGRPERRQPALLLDVPQLFGDPDGRLQLELLRPLRPGRPAGQPTLQGAVRAALRPLQGPGRAAVRRQPALRRASRSTRTTSRRGSGFSWTLDAERAHGAARLQRGSCTSRRCSTSTRTPSSATATRARSPRRLNPTSAGRARLPGHAQPTCRPASRCPLQSIVAMDPDFSTQYTILTNVQLERALTSDLSVSVGYVNSHRPQHAGAGGHQPDPDRPDAGRRPPDLLHRGQRSARA